MRVRYDAETGTLVAVFREAEVAESDEERPGFILGYDQDGQPVAIEALDASHRIDDPRRVQFTEAA